MTLVLSRGCFSSTIVMIEYCMIEPLGTGKRGPETEKATPVGVASSNDCPAV
ncbi:hypothetical protein ABH927_006912, partial [Planotetraspora sp. GP83]